MNFLPTINDIIEASGRIAPYVHKTPVLTSVAINSITGTKLFFKCENFQKAGAFKSRGATNAVFSLSEQECKRGVTTHSSGNHAAALALAAGRRNAKSYIVMPENAPEIKKKAVAGYGAEVIFCEATVKAREETCQKVIEEKGAVFIHPYNNEKIITGQATCAKEIIDEIGDPDFIISPLGGGGLLSGTLASAVHFGKNIKVIGAEPKGADDAFRSVRDGKIYPSVNPETIADGLLTQLGDLTFGIVSKYVDEIITVEESSIVAAMRMIWERMKIIVEPSAAVSLAVVMENEEKFAGKKTALILSGGNVDLEKLPWDK